MIKPGKLTKDKLAHPKSERRSKFQGDVIRAKEEQGFSERRKVNGCSVVHGTKPQSNVRPVEHGRHAAAHAPLVRDLKPTANPQVFVPVMRPAEPLDIPELSKRQAKMLKGKG